MLPNLIQDPESGKSPHNNVKYHHPVYFPTKGSLRIANPQPRRTGKNQEEEQRCNTMTGTGDAIPCLCPRESNGAAFARFCCTFPGSIQAPFLVIVNCTALLAGSPRCSHSLPFTRHDRRDGLH